MIFLLNAAIAGTLAVLAFHGHAAAVFHDPTYMTHGISLLGACSVLWSLWLYHRARTYPDAERAAGWLVYLAAALVGLGLLGTVVGFRNALIGIDAAGVGDVAAIGPMVGALLAGMGTALNTTLVGTVFALWVDLNARQIGAWALRLPVEEAA
jgi:hypothetical protein